MGYSSCISLIVLRGPLAARERFHAEASADPEFFSAHAPLDAGDSFDAWGTAYWHDCPPEVVVINEELTEYEVSTERWPPHKWLDAASSQFPELTFELFSGNYEECFGSFLRAHAGKRVVEDIVFGTEFYEVYARHGRPGWFLPWWVQDEDERRFELVLEEAHNSRVDEPVPSCNALALEAAYEAAVDEPVGSDIEASWAPDAALSTLLAHPDGR